MYIYYYTHVTTKQKNHEEELRAKKSFDFNAQSPIFSLQFSFQFREKKICGPSGKQIDTTKYNFPP